MNGLGITITNKEGTTLHTFRDFGLKWASMEIGVSEPITQYVQIPGSNNYIDRMDAIKVNNEPILGRRNLTARFDAEGRMEEWETKISILSNFLNGQTVKMVLDTDPQFFYRGVAHVETIKEDYSDCEYSIILDAEPYKYDILSSTDDWLWGPFNFQTGIIVYASNLRVSNSTVTIPGGEASTIPEIIVHSMSTSTLKVQHNSRSYELREGRNRFPQIRVGKTDVALAFVGTGVVSIEYRRRSQ